MHVQGNHGKVLLTVFFLDTIIVHITSVVIVMFTEATPLHFH